MFCNPSYTDKINRMVSPSRGGVVPIGDGLGAIDWNALVQQIPAVLQTGAQVYSSLEAGKYNPIATYNVPYGVTPSAAGVSWTGALTPAAALSASQMQSYIPYILAAGGVLAAVLLLRR